MGSVFTPAPVPSRSSCLKFIIDDENIPVNACQRLGLVYSRFQPRLRAAVGKRWWRRRGERSRVGFGAARPRGAAAAGSARGLSPLTGRSLRSGEGFRSRLCSPAEPPPHSSRLPLSFGLNRGNLGTIWIMLTIAYLEPVFSPPSLSPGLFLPSEPRGWGFNSPSGLVPLRRGPVTPRSPLASRQR